MIRRPPRSTRTDTLFPYTTLFRSQLQPVIDRALAKRSKHPFILPELGPMMVKFGKSTIYGARSEEHTSELQSLMRISYAVFCLKKKKKYKPKNTHTISTTQTENTTQMYI